MDSFLVLRPWGKHFAKMERVARSLRGAPPAHQDEGDGRGSGLGSVPPAWRARVAKMSPDERREVFGTSDVREILIKLHG